MRTLAIVKGISFHTVGSHSHATEIVLVKSHRRSRKSEIALDPLADGVVISHKEGHDRGIASNHGDPEHLWSRFSFLPYSRGSDLK